MDRAAEAKTHDIWSLMISGASSLAGRVITWCSPPSSKLKRISMGMSIMSSSDLDATYYCVVGQKKNVLKMVELVIESIRSSQMFLESDVHQQLWRLEPVPPQKKSMWRRWLLCVSDHIVEMIPSWQTFPDGSKLELQQQHQEAATMTEHQQQQEALILEHKHEQHYHTILDQFGLFPTAADVDHHVQSTAVVASGGGTSSGGCCSSSGGRNNPYCHVICMVKEVFHHILKPRRLWGDYACGEILCREARLHGKRRDCGGSAPPFEISSLVVVLLGLFFIIGAGAHTIPAPVRSKSPRTPFFKDAPVYHLPVHSPPPPPPPSPPPPPATPPPSHHRPRPWVVPVIIITSILGVVGSGGGVFYFIRRYGRMTDHAPPSPCRTSYIEFIGRELGMKV